MNWKAMTAAAVLGACASGAAAADATRHHALFQDPTARVYLSLGFGLPASSERPLRYGMRMDTHNAADWFDRPAFAGLDFDRGGLAAATMNGLPLLQRDAALYADGEVVYNWADFGVLAIGALGLGYIVYELVDSDSGSSPQPSEENGNGDGNGDGGGDGLLCNLLPILCLADTRSTALDLERSRSYRAWRDGGTGQMGDLD